MKNPLVQKIPYALLLLVFYLPLSAQTISPQRATERFGIDADGGIAIPTGKDFNSVFYTGADMSLGFKIAVLNSKKLWIKPLFGLTIYDKKAVEIDKDARESFDIAKAGIELQYRAAQIKRFSLCPTLRATHNWCTNYFAKPTDSYTSSNLTIQTTAVSNNYLKGSGFSFDAGLMILKEHWYLKLDYDYFSPTLKVHPDIINAALAQGIAVPASTSFNCSTISIGLGINFNFR